VQVKYFFVELSKETDDFLIRTDKHYGIRENKYENDHIFSLPSLKRKLFHIF